MTAVPPLSYLPALDAMKGDLSALPGSCFLELTAVVVKHGGRTYPIEVDLSAPALVFKDAIYQETGVPVCESAGVSARRKVMHQLMQSTHESHAERDLEGWLCYSRSWLIMCRMTPTCLALGSRMWVTCNLKVLMTKGQVIPVRRLVNTDVQVVGAAGPLPRTPPEPVQFRELLKLRV